jgi:hypothetical protein
MKMTGGKLPFYTHILLVVVCLTFWPGAAVAAKRGEDKAPGRIMADQATKGSQIWHTTDHARHEVLQQDFKSGIEITRACLSCHSEAEAQFHKRIRQGRQFTQQFLYFRQ